MPRFMTSGAIAALHSEGYAIRKRLCCEAVARESAPVVHTAERLYEFTQEHHSESIWATRLATICQLLEIVQEAPVPKTFDRVSFGCMVKVRYLAPDDAMGDFNCIIDGQDAPQAFPDIMTVSSVSPLGKALLRKEVGDDIEIQLPGNGLRHAQVVSISHSSSSRSAPSPPNYREGTIKAP
jgi:transcription elongation GreA/GreB family factor